VRKQARTAASRDGAEGMLTTSNICRPSIRPNGGIRHLFDIWVKTLKLAQIGPRPGVLVVMAR
jgi:hypothetical protein